MRRVLVTGATSFAGHRLAARLLQEGLNVHLLHHRGPHLQRLYALPGRPALHEHDGSTEALFRILERAAPDTVFHLAAVTPADHRPEDVKPMVDSNVLLGTQLLEACARLKIPRFVNTGTYWQHYKSRDYDPVDLYAATKQAFEDVMRFYAETAETRMTTLCLVNAYGPGDERGKFLSQLQAAHRTGETLALSPGRQLMDFIYVDDAVEAFLHAAKLLELRADDVHGRAFTVGAGEPVTLRELAALYERLAQTSLPVSWGARPYRPRQMMSPWRGCPLPGWKPKVTLEEGLRRTLQAAAVPQPTRHG